MRYIVPVPSIHWVTDRHCTFVARPDGGAVVRLAGLEEALWDCLTQGYSYPRIIRFFAALRDSSPEAAGELVQGILREWRDLGIVAQKEEEVG